jgi:hypothetical protein
MKKISLTVLTLFFVLLLSAQKINKLTLTNNGSSAEIRYGLSENVVIILTPEGTIKEWGVDRYAGRIDNMERKLDEYTGRIEYYNESENEAFRGKIRFIGGTAITYYASFDNEHLIGKVKSIGASKINYFIQDADKAKQGRIKSAGDVKFDYYASYDNEASRGKFKKMGTAMITYYGALEDKGFAGKPKTLDNQTFVYYSSQDYQVAFRGMLKSGNTTQVINGIVYWVKF